MKTLLRHWGDPKTLVRWNYDVKYDHKDIQETINVVLGHKWDATKTLTWIPKYLWGW